jgi:hypothetical protein
MKNPKMVQEQWSVTPDKMTIVPFTKKRPEDSKGTHKNKLRGP